LENGQKESSGKNDKIASNESLPEFYRRAERAAKGKRHASPDSQRESGKNRLGGGGVWEVGGGGGGGGWGGGGAIRVHRKERYYGIPLQVRTRKDQSSIDKEGYPPIANVDQKEKEHCALLGTATESPDRPKDWMLSAATS